MKKTVEDIRNDVIDSIVERAERFGFPRIAGQLKGLLYLSPHPLSLDEMAARLEISKGSASTNIRLLERWKVVKKVYHRGTRKNLYAFRGDIWEIETEIVSTIMKEEIARTKTLLKNSGDDLEKVQGTSKQAKEEIAFIKKKFDELSEYIESAEYLMNLFLERGNITPALVKKVKIT